MHGSTKLKFSDAKQAREIYNYKKAVPAVIRRFDDLPATITHVPVAAVLVLNTPDAGRLTPETCRVTLQK
jgi:hypothetical protein